MGFGVPDLSRKRGEETIAAIAPFSRSWEGFGGRKDEPDLVMLQRLP